jgi:signal transduction histidine kinase/CheY-like chemotaxis protein/HPt (histidine-containing phosphotransfer) domain-containing protein
VLRIFDNLTKKAPFLISALISAGLVFCCFSPYFAREPINSALHVIIFFMAVVNAALCFQNDRRVDALTKKLRAASRAKSDFLANMSHEIRTPMNAISGLSYLMPEDNLSSLQKNYLHDIRKMSKTLLGIINNILDFSKIEAGKMEIIQVHFNLTTLFNDIVSMCGFMAYRKSLQLRAHIDETLPDVVYGDEIRIRQILVNIITNAVKYTRSGYVDFKMTRETSPGGVEYITAVVEDTGIGIPKDDMAKLFGTFQRLNTNKNRMISGTGLGLAITKQLLDLLGGSINVESEYKKGSRFTIRVPLIPGDPLKIEKETRVSNFAVARENSEIRILAADDSPINLTVIKGYLAEHNMSADICGNGKEALNKVMQKEYDIVFLDHMMPEMDGTETAKRIRMLDGEYYKKLPIIALSANAVSGARELFIESGMNDFISKPIDADQLNSALLKFLPAEKIAVNPAPPSKTKLTHEYNADNEIIWNEEERKIFRELSLIPGLNTQDGVANAGNRAADYFKILRQFIDGVDQNIEKIESNLLNQKWRDYAILVHAYRGVLAIIGMNGLAKSALRLEMAAKSVIESENGVENPEDVKSLEENIKLCAEETPSLCGSLASLRAGIAKILPHDKTQIEKIKIDAPALKEKLTALKAACDLSIGKDSDEISAELEKYTFTKEADAELADIRGLTASFRFPEAVAKIDVLLEKI